MLTRFDAIYYAFSPVLLPYLGLRWARRRKYRHSGPGMLGRGLPGADERKRFAKGSVWIHAVSVGEVAAARAVMPHLRELFPDRPFVISTITETGQEAALRDLPDAEAHTYFPADLSWNVRRFLDAYQPRYVILLEAELWPNFLSMASGRGAEIFMINAKLSDRSFPRYRYARGLMGGIFGSLAGVCAQTPEDARRFGEVGVAKNQIQATGNCKFDLEIEPVREDEKARWRSEIGIRPDRPLIVAGSTHPGEEELILDAFTSVRRAIPGACLLITPRHPERFGEVAKLARGRGFTTSMSSKPEAAPNPDSEPAVVVLDKMGVLARAYGLGDVAIVAGSFCPTGGHNLLEAAAHGVPVVYGPNMRSQRDIARLFAAGGAGTQVGEEELAGALERLLTDKQARRKEGELCRAVLDNNHGSAARSVAAIREWLAPEAE